jgi:DNA repair exonuclease SbcCD ATPase subunit
MKKKNISLFLFYSCHSDPVDTSGHRETKIIKSEENLKTKEVEIKDLKKQIEDLKNNNSNISNIELEKKNKDLEENLKTKEVEIKDLKKQIEDLKNNNSSIYNTELEKKNKDIEENLKTKEVEIEELRKELQNIKSQNDRNKTDLEKLKDLIVDLGLKETPIGEYVNKLEEKDKEKILNLYFYLEDKFLCNITNLFEKGKKYFMYLGRNSFVESIEKSKNLKEAEVIYFIGNQLLGKSFLMKIYIEKNKKYLEFCCGKTVLVKYEIENKESFSSYTIDSFQSYLFNSESEFDELKSVLKSFFSKIEIVK